MNMKVANVQVVFLFVSDLPTSVEYYQKLLGLQAVQHGDTQAAFDVYGVQLMLHADGDTERVPSGSVRGAGVSVHFKVDDAHAYWENLKQLEIPLMEPPEDQPWGYREFGVKDPDGYEIEFVQPL
jgi:catechol 2,3-dioxygenase-like lactoylglutathione lyase family enzyme